jgi:hypothetical protein
VGLAAGEFAVAEADDGRVAVGVKVISTVVELAAVVARARRRAEEMGPRCSSWLRR